MNVSEYVIHFLEEKNIDTAFGVVGGAILWICKALNESTIIRPVFTNHEQVAAMSADGWARISGKPGVVFAINGPGMTNTITGIAQAWVDSSPVILITGNSNSRSVMYEREKGIRQYGTQDVRTDKLMEGITKKYFFLESADDIGIYLEEAYDLTLSGRKGPVCIEIPINIQSARISDKIENHLEIYTKNKKIEARTEERMDENNLGLIVNKLATAKRPLILAGQGIRLSDMVDEFRQFITNNKIPVVNSRMGIDTIDSDSRYFVGRAGNHGSRPAHFALQTCDVLLILGSRLAPNTTGYDVSKFSQQSCKILIDVDDKELNKLGIHMDYQFHMDLKDFFIKINKKMIPLDSNSRERWIACCNDWKSRYPIMRTKYYDDKEISTYRVIEAVSSMAGDNDLILSDTGSCCSIVAQVWKVKSNQRLFISGGLSAMGYWATSIGLAVANKGNGQVICFVGDGSLQMNIHEFATIKHYGLTIKIFVINNSGYQFVRMSQTAYGIVPPFGTDINKGVPIPDTGKLSKAYGLNYRCCDNAQNLLTTIEQTLNSMESEICEIFVQKEQEVCPRLKSMVLENGTFVSPNYENLYPFLKKDVLAEELRKAY